MRIDSCRKCGTELEENKKCDICLEINQFFCHNCGYTTDEQIHSKCFLEKSNCILKTTAV